MQPHHARPLVYAWVSAMGLGVQLAALGGLAAAGVPVPAATAVAVLAAIVHNFLWHRRWTWRDREHGGFVRESARLARYTGLNGVVSLVGAVAITTYLEGVGVPLLGANVVAVAACGVLNFLLADRIVFAIVAAIALGPGTAEAATPGARTLATWDEYVRETERRIQADEPHPDSVRVTPGEWRRLATGDVLLRQRQTRRQDGSEIDIADGAVHHWVGRVFLPGVRLESLLAELQAPTRRQWLPPEVQWMRVSGSGRQLGVAMRVVRTGVVDVTYDTSYRVEYARHAGGHATSRSVSTRIAQVYAPGTPQERPATPDEDHGFLWRLNAYWRYLPANGGVLVECESLALSRSVPLVLRVLAGPIVDRVSRESLDNTLRALRTGFPPRPVADGNPARRTAQ